MQGNDSAGAITTWATDPYARVRAFLGDADIRPEFAARAFARIEAQSDELGSSYSWASLGALIGDARRQAVDVAGYSAVIAARVAQDAGDRFAERRAGALLASAAQRAAEADAMLGELGRLVERVA
jgi:hypothetical protein